VIENSNLHDSLVGSHAEVRAVRGAIDVGDHSKVAGE
jgi:hypothetical protein